MAEVERRIRAMGYTPQTSRGELRNVIGAIGDDRGQERLRALESLECVETVTPILQPFKMASREVRSGNTQIVKDVAFDCDGDTLLIQVEQNGPACHEGYKSCFFRSIEGKGETWKTTEPQLKTPEELYGKKK